MRYDLQRRPGLTAIAAVLALSATPALAQDITSAAAQPPVAVAPLPAESAPAPALAEPGATPVETSPVTSQVEPAPTQPEVSTAPVAPVPTMQPIVHQPSAADLRAARAVDRTPAAPRAAAPAPTQRSEAARPMPVAAKVTPIAPTAAPAADVAPLASAQRTTTTTTAASGSDVLPYAGLGAAALLLVGSGFALSRRRRDDELATDEVEQEPVLGLAPTTRVAEPTFAAPAVARVAARPTGATSLPTGFDLSRYGRHTRAAYQGPTPENPSLSLRKRLKRASFFDGRERIAAETGNASLIPPLAAAARTTRAPVNGDGQIVIRPRPAKTGNFLRPSFAFAR